MKRVTISGFYGFHNIGDEAILWALIEQLRHIAPDVHITVLSHNAEETARNYKVESVPRYSVFAALRAIRRSDIVISGGGSLLQDRTSKRSIYYYLAILLLGFLFRKKVFLISNGIGPIDSRWNRFLVRKALNRAVHTTVRDYDSEQLLHEIGVHPEKVSVSADLVLAMERKGDDFGNRVLTALGVSPREAGRKRIAIAIRQKDFRTEERRSQLIWLANTLAKDHDVIFVPFYYKNDTKICGDIRESVGAGVFFINEKYSSEEFMSIVESFDLLIGSRLHSLVFSVVAEIPFVGISYDPKIEAFLAMLDRTPATSMDHFDPEAVVRAARETLSHRDEEVARVKTAHEAMRQRIAINEEVLKPCLE